MSVWAARDHHRFEAAGRPFVYLAPSAAVFALDDPADKVLASLSQAPATSEELVTRLSEHMSGTAVEQTLAELARVQAVGMLAPARAEPQPTGGTRPKVIPLAQFPLSTMVLNVTNQCNLSCTYCYEYGEDKIVDTQNGRKPKFMSEETARQSVDFMLKESRSNPVAHLTFFGGETLLNFPVLRKTIDYARRRAAELGKQVDFSLTTNATLLKPEIIEFLADEQVGVTISIDGPREVQDRFRVFHNGSGSYDVVEPKIRELLARHRSRPIGARVTLTAGGATGTLLRQYQDDLPMLFIVSQADLQVSEGGEDTLAIDVVRAEGYKCARCWRTVDTISSSPDTDGLCERCVAALGGSQAA